MSTVFEQIGQRIEKWIEENNSNQSHFAELLGVSKQVMSKIINGKKATNIIEIQKIAEIMNVSIDELLNMKEEPQVIQQPILFMMGQLKNEKTKSELQFLDHVMDEMAELKMLLSKE